MRVPAALLSLLLVSVLAAPASADWTASGVFRYRDRLQDLTGFTGLTDEKPIRYARVEIVRSPGTVLAVGATDENGAFEITVSDDQTSTVFCRVVSLDNSPTLNLRVQSSSIATTTYAVAGIDITNHQPTTDVDFQVIVAEPGAGGEAFNILDVMVDGSDYAKELLGFHPAPACTTVWSSGSTTGTFFSGNRISLLGEEGYDDAVIAHEHGHFIDVNFSESDSPGGPHFLGDNNQDIRLAWGEGVASWHMAAGRILNGRPNPNWYIDTTGGSGPGNLNFSYEIEEPNISAIGAASEVTVQAALYDLVDGALDDELPSDDDVREYAVSMAWNVMQLYLPTVPIVSLEDFWDGWFSPQIDNGDLPGIKSVFEAFRVEFFPDGEEPDDVPAEAAPIALTGEPQVRTFYPAGDVDMARFTSPGPGVEFVVETVNLLSDANTRIEILDHDGATVLASNADRSAGDESSLLVWTAPEAGDYFVKVDHQPDVGVYGSYSLRVVQGTVSPVQFTNVAVAAGVGSPRAGRGSAWGDYDNDGRPDLFVTNASGQFSHLYRNLPGGTFTDVAFAAGVSGNGGTGEQAVWGDYDNDGFLDLYVATLTTNLLYRNNGDGTFTESGAAAGVNYTGQGSLGASWADYDGDGWLDLFVATIGADDVLYRNDGEGTFTDVTSAAGIGGDGEDTFGGTWADYDDDGDVDLFVHHDTAANSLFRNDDGDFEEVTPEFMAERTVRSWGATWGDYDSDGDLDLFVSTLGSPCRLYRNDGGEEPFTDVSAAAGVDATGSQTGNLFADFDLDGDLDIYMSAFEEPNIHLDNLTGSAYYRSGRAAVNVQSRSTTSADYDLDGDPDIYVVNATGNNVLYANGSAPGAWLRVKLEGTVSNRAAIGAGVTLRSGGRRQIQVVSGGSGYISQNDQALTFGLGASPGPDTLEIRWPSGIIQTVTDLARNQTHVIEEKDGTPVIDPPPPPTGAPTRIALAQNLPNPFRRSTRIRFDLPRPMEVRLEVLDVQGRLVATLVDRVVNIGTHEFEWNGHLAKGAPAPSGIYFFRLLTPEGALTRKMILAP